MKILPFAIMLFASGLAAQTTTVTANRIRAAESLRVGGATSPKITGFDTSIPGSPTDAKVPTSKAVSDYINDQTILQGEPAAGDLDGTLPGPTVDGIQGRPVSASAPSTGQVLKWSGSQWAPATDNTGSGGGGSINTDATLTGDGSPGTPLGIAQQSATTSAFLAWSGATWEPSWGNPYLYVTSGSPISTAVNEIMIGTLSADITIGLPDCNATTDSKHFKFIRNGSDAFSVTIDPSSTQAFFDGASVKIIFGKLSIDCTCRFSSGTGTWFTDNF